jgi:GDP/UDP-N,N'-diacetylbacillosamine 2-epimerase (hydrolysing)
MGEDPLKVFNVGSLGVENIRNLKLMDQAGLEKKIGFPLGKRAVLVTFHPVTLEKNSAGNQVGSLLDALDCFPDLTILFTKANADEQGRLINRTIEAYVDKNSRARVFASLGQEMYINTLAHVRAVVGNSSSGIIEAPSLGIPTVNIGNRQGGRIKADSVIDCMPDIPNIVQALEIALSEEFRNFAARVVNPYEKPDTAAGIKDILKQEQADYLKTKSFYDIKKP